MWNIYISKSEKGCWSQLMDKASIIRAAALFDSVEEAIEFLTAQITKIDESEIVESVLK